MTRQSIILSIIDLSRGGAGVGRDSEGKIVFVPYTAPGDEVEVTILKKYKNYSDGQVIRWIQKSPIHQTPRCAVFGKCGGCLWQHLPYELQFETKAKGVEQALKRAQVTLPGTPSFFPANDPWNYRNRIQLRGAGSEVGFYERGSQNRVPIERCEISDERLNEHIQLLQTKGNPNISSGEYKLELSIGPKGHVLESWNTRHGALGFRQINENQNKKLQNWVQAQAESGEILLDLFGGTGNLSWSLQPEFQSIHCVDVGSPGHRLPEQSPQFHFHRSSVDRWIKVYSKQFKNHLSKNPHPHTVIIDPPREGIQTEFKILADAFKKIGVQKIIAVGCDPDAWARDLRHWIDEGYRFESCAIFDFFPQTPHIESAAVLCL